MGKPQTHRENLFQNSEYYVISISLQESQNNKPHPKSRRHRMRLIIKTIAQSRTHELKHDVLIAVCSVHQHIFCCCLLLGDNTYIDGQPIISSAKFITI